MSKRGRAALVAVVVVFALAAVGCASGSNLGSTKRASATGTTAVARSAGCSHPSSPVAASQVTIPVHGAERSYILDVPASATAGRPAPLVVDLHGMSEGAVVHRQVSRFADLGQDKGFITATPMGRGPAASVFFDARPGSVDVDFVRAVLDDVGSKQCVDPRRVYAAGYSNGAFLSSTLACVMADRFAAVAPVEGIRDIPGCKPSRRVPVIAFHGTADEWVRYGGGVSVPASKVAIPAEWTGPRDLPGINSVIPGSIFEPIPKVVAAWARRNGCSGSPRETAASSEVTLVAYGCPKGAEVELYRITGAGHTWPGSAAMVPLAPVLGKTTTSIDATGLIWAFFSRHALPAG
jgi:polyhydroxybutyrate depolymerase